MARIVAAHAVLWAGLLILLLSSGPWSRAISNALFQSSGYGRWTFAALTALIFSILTLPLAVAIVLAGRSVGRVAGGLGLVLITIVLGAATASPAISNKNALTAIWVLMAVTLSAAWIVARRRSPLALLAVLLAALVAYLINMAGETLLSGRDGLDLKWGALAAIPLVIAAWAAVGIDAATSPRPSGYSRPPVPGVAYPPPGSAPQQPWSTQQEWSPQQQAWPPQQ